MKTKSLIAQIAFCLLFVAAVKAQDIHMSLFSQTPLTINPAQAGTTAWIRGLINYRNQWSSVPVPYSTIMASFDQKVKKRWLQREPKTRTLLFKQNTEKGLGWGVNFYNDQAGDGHMGTLQANGSLGYQVQVTHEGMLAAGLQLGLLQRSINYNKLYWENQYDATATGGFNTSMSANENFASHSFIRPDASVGILYSYKKNERYMRGNDQKDIQVGGSIYHLNRPKYSFFGNDERLAMRGNAYLSGTLGITNTNMAFSPGILYSRQGPNQEFLVGTLLRYMLKEDSKYTGYVKGAAISAGGFYRNNDAIAIAALFEFGAYALGVSYDLNTSKLKEATGGRGGLEISFRFLNPAPFLFSQASFNK